MKRRQDATRAIGNALSACRAARTSLKRALNGRLPNESRRPWLVETLKRLEADALAVAREVYLAEVGK